MYTLSESNYMCGELRNCNSIMVIGIEDIPLSEMCASLSSTVYVINRPLFGNWDDWIKEAFLSIDSVGGKRPIPIEKYANEFGTSFHDSIDALVLSGSYYDFEYALISWIIHLVRNGDIFIFNYKHSQYVNNFIDKILVDSKSFNLNHKTNNMMHFSKKMENT